MTTPYLGWDFKLASVGGRKGSYIVRDKTGLELKGSLQPSKMSDGTPVLLFLGTPRLTTLEDLQVPIWMLKEHPKEALNFAVSGPSG